MTPANDNPRPRRPTRFGLALVTLIKFGPLVVIAWVGSFLAMTEPKGFAVGVGTAFICALWHRIAEKAEGASTYVKENTPDAPRS